jgi:hypothetical protein
MQHWEQPLPPGWLPVKRRPAGHPLAPVLFPPPGEPCVSPRDEKSYELAVEVFFCCSCGAVDSVSFLLYFYLWTVYTCWGAGSRFPQKTQQRIQDR